jgi:transcriptional regulator with XRE-family HTH domain
LTREALSMVAQNALKAATPSMRELAEETGLTYSTLRAWSAGARIPSAAHASTLARALKARAAKLEALAAELERAAGEE